jgi:hypothetical protein
MTYTYNDVRVSVTEKRAPTDESIRLYREMEEKARASIIKAVSVIDNKFNAMVHAYRDHLSGKNRFIIIFTLNGHKHDVEVETFDDATGDEIVQKVVDAVAHRVACEFLRVPLTKAMLEMRVM